VKKNIVAIVKYENKLDSIKKLVALSNGLINMPGNAKVFIKPNIVFFSKNVPFPKWGVITTSRVIEDMVIILKENGIDDITICEGTVVMDPKDMETAQHAYKVLGYETLNKRYGVKYINIFENKFKKINLGDDIILNFNEDIVESDFIINIPVLKTHNQTVVSLGIKNLKGLIDIASRKKCHNCDPEKNLHYYVSKLADKMPEMLTIIDGIYSNERGPGIDGKMRRSNLLIASNDVLSADIVGAKVLGHNPDQVPYISHAAKRQNRKLDLSDIEIKGLSIDDIALRHEFDFVYSDTQDGCLPLPMAKQGIKGIYYRKFDLSMCTYCSGINGVILSAVRYAWKGEKWDDIEVLTGKSMKPTPGMKKTILIGQCMYKANKDNPDINELIAVKGCPPNPDKVVDALHKAGIDVDRQIFENIDQMPAFFMAKYQNKKEFDESFFQIQ